MSTKDPAIDIARGFAVFLLVYGHVIQRSMAPWGEDFFLAPAFKIVYAFHMPLFFYISGYLMANTFLRRGLMETLKSRIRGILVPFAVWGFLGVITEYVLNIIDGKSWDVSRFPVDCFDQLVWDPVIWFLFTLFAAGCLLILSVYLEKKIGPAAFLVVYLGLMAAPFNQQFALYYLQWFYPFYLVGYWFNRRSLKYDSSLTAWLVGFIIFIVLASFWEKSDYIYIHKMNFHPGQFVMEWVRMIYRYGVGFLGVFLAMRLGVLWSGTRFGKVFALLGIYSLDIYLLQRYIVEGLYPRAVQGLQLVFDFTGPVFFTVWASILAAVFVGLCLVISKYFLRPYAIFNKFLLGGRA